MFILELTLRAWNAAEESKRRTLQRSDVAQAITRTDIFDFLVRGFRITLYECILCLFPLLGILMEYCTFQKIISLAFYNDHTACVMVSCYAEYVFTCIPHHVPPSVLSYLVADRWT